MWENIIDKCKDKKFSSLPQWVTLMPASIFPVMDAKGMLVTIYNNYVRRIK